MKNLLLPFCLIFFFCKNSVSQIYIAGETYLSTSEYIEYKAGNLPIVISAPHGGTLEPSEVPDRDCAGCSTIRDFATDDLARKIYDAIADEFGCYPHVIINRLHRKKLDANREIVEAAQGNPMAEQAWNEFHDFIESSKDSITANFAKGIFLDLHGHGHDIQRLELGYLLSRSKLQMSDTVLNDASNIDISSIMNLVNDNLNAINHADLIRGATSFGEFYEIENYPAVPCQTNPFPIGDEAYFSGGYNTVHHGSSGDGTIDGIQIECNRDGVRDTESNRTAFAIATARVLKQYLEVHYFGSGGLDNNCGTVALEKTNFNNVITFTVSPNPIDDFLTIKTSDASIGSIFIYNQLGQTFYQQKNILSSELTLNSLLFPKGVYFFKIDNKDNTGWVKLVKN